MPEDERSNRRFERYHTSWPFPGGEIIDVSEKGFAFTYDKLLETGTIVGLSVSDSEPLLFGRIMRIIKASMYGVELDSQLTQRLQARQPSDLLRSYHDQVQKIINSALHKTENFHVSCIHLGHINWVQPDFFLDEAGIVKDLIRWFHREMQIQEERGNHIEKLSSYSMVADRNNNFEKAVEHYENILLRKIFQCESVHVEVCGEHTKEEIEKELPWVGSLFFQQEIVKKAIDIADTTERALNHRTDLFKSVVNEFDMAILIRSDDDNGDVGALELF
jgi:hypothetical protein